MADEGKPPAGRGSAGGRGGQRKAKFAPTVPSQRRRKADEALGSAGGATSAAEAAAANEAFQDLIRAAQSESKWQRGRGRGYGRGRRGSVAQVMFGGDGNDIRRGPAAVPQPRAAPKPKAEGKPGVKGEAGSSSSSRRRLKPNVKPDGADSAGGHTYDDDYEGDDYEDGGQDLATLFDYEQYFPTTLPLPLHHPLDDEADPAADAALMRHGLPEELALRQDDPEGATAAQLGLTNLSTAADTLYLFQLPSLLPLGTTSSADPRKGRSAAAAAAAAAGSSSGQQQQQAASARELPSGHVGKLLVFKSGRVKLQMGPCLLDVSAGMPCVTRQDIAAINKTTGHLIQLGPVTQRAVVCPDVWQLMDDKEVPVFRRDLQQQQQGPLTNGFGRGDKGDRMDLDDDEEMADFQDDEMGNGMGGGRSRKQQQQQELESPESSEDEEGDEQQQQQQARQRRLAQQISSSSEGEEEGSKSPAPVAAAAEADADAGQQQQQPAAAAAAMPPKQPGQQQQQQFVRNNWLDVPSGPARGAAAGRGRGKFRPSTRSPSPGLAAAAAAAGGLKQEDAMDVDS